MESAKRASVGNNCVVSGFFFFLKRGEARGKEVKNQQSKKSSRHARGKGSHHQKQQKVQFRKKSKEFFIFHSHETDDPFTTHTLRFQTHTHTHML